MNLDNSIYPNKKYNFWSISARTPVKVVCERYYTLSIYFTYIIYQKHAYTLILILLYFQLYTLYLNATCLYGIIKVYNFTYIPQYNFLFFRSPDNCYGYVDCIPADEMTVTYDTGKNVIKVPYQDLKANFFTTLDLYKGNNEIIDIKLGKV